MCAISDHLELKQIYRSYSIVSRTYLKLEAVHSFVATVHNSLVDSWPCNGSHSAINEPKALGQGRTFGMIAAEIFQDPSTPG